MFICIFFKALVTHTAEHNFGKGLEMCSHCFVPKEMAWDQIALKFKDVIGERTGRNLSHKHFRIQKKLIEQQ